MVALWVGGPPLGNVPELLYLPPRKWTQPLSSKYPTYISVLPLLTLKCNYLLHVGPFCLTVRAARMERSLESLWQEVGETWTQTTLAKITSVGTPVSSPPHTLQDGPWQIPCDGTLPPAAPASCGQPHLPGKRNFSLPVVVFQWLSGMNKWMKLTSLLVVSYVFLLFAVEALSCVRLFAIPWTAGRQASLCFTISRSLLELMSIGLVMPSNHCILCCPLLLLPSILPSIRVFSNESALHIRWPNYWSFSFSTSPSNEYSGVISFRMDLFDLSVQERVWESSLAPQFESINSAALSLFNGPPLMSVHDYWKNHSFDYMDLCQQSDVFGF